MGTLTDLDLDAADPRPDIGRLLAHLEDRLAELEHIQHELCDDARALAAALQRVQMGTSARSVLSIREAAAELGISVSMVHKLLKERRLGHLKVGARTIITTEHLKAFRRASEVQDARPAQLSSYPA